MLGVKTTDVPVRIDEETKLVCMMAVTLMSNGVNTPINLAFATLDSIIKIQEVRLEKRIEEETKRRKGY